MKSPSSILYGEKAGEEDKDHTIKWQMITKTSTASEK